MKLVWPITLLLLVCSCTWDQPVMPDKTQTETQVNSCLPDSAKFTRDLQPVFNYYCVGTYCHSGAHPPGEVNLDAGTSYNALISGGYINTADPEQSLLYKRITSSTDPMPPYGNMDKCKTDLILKWIRQGALEK